LKIWAVSFLKVCQALQGTELRPLRGIWSQIIVLGSCLPKVKVLLQCHDCFHPQNPGTGDKLELAAHSTLWNKGFDQINGKPSELRGKTIFITGASRGIGLEIAKRCAREGANVCIAAKTVIPHPTLPGTIYTAGWSTFLLAVSFFRHPRCSLTYFCWQLRNAKSLVAAHSQFGSTFWTRKP